MAIETAKFPVGGERHKVYKFLEHHGFTMSKWSDKHWTRADGLALHVYGSGSMARITNENGDVLADDDLDVAVCSLEYLPPMNG